MAKIIRSYKDIFAGRIDECERMIGCLQYCSFIPIRANDSPNSSNPTSGGLRFIVDEGADISSFFEKGSLYRGMISDLHDFSLLDQCFYIIQKFTEFRER